MSDHNVETILMRGHNVETILMRGHYVCFYGAIRKTIPKISLSPILIQIQDMVQ